MSSDPTSGFLRKSGTSIFGGAVALRGVFYDRGLLSVHRVEGLHVISVGNIRVGGSGKTPLAMHLATDLRDRGIKTAILYRGYKGKLEHMGGLVSTGSGPIVSPEDAGDEAYLASVRTRGIFVFAGADREKGARLVRELGASVAVLDDGFQRRSLHRDLDIVLVSPEDTAPGAQLLPSGPLRESPSALERAHIVGGFFSDWKVMDKKPDLLFKYTPTAYVDLESGETRPLGDFKGSKVHLVTGIARPERFRDTASQVGLNIVGTSEFQDHHKFSTRNLQTINQHALEKGAELIVTTEKDLTRMGGMDFMLPVFGLSVDVEICNGSEMLNEYLSKVMNIFGPDLSK